MGTVSSTTFVITPPEKLADDQIVELKIWSDEQPSHRYEISAFAASSDSPCVITIERRRMQSDQVILGMGTIRLNGYVPNFSLPMYECQITAGWEIWVKVFYKTPTKISPVDISIQGTYL